MPLQNRVTPLGDIVTNASRGLFIGNRGIIHDPLTRTLLRRRWSTRAWIVCSLRYKDHHRKVMSTNSWTELFFLDEVTALSAGHRPCFFCRRQAAKSFAIAAHADGGVDSPRAPAMDAMLHAQRAASGATLERLPMEQVATLPDGTTVTVAGKIHMLRAGLLLAWSMQGYGSPSPCNGLLNDEVTIITPALTRHALSAGYQPEWHPSAIIPDNSPAS
jgi:hypothetical protein